MSSGGSGQGPTEGELKLSKIALDQWSQFGKPILERAAPQQADAVLHDRQRGLNLGRFNASTTQAFDSKLNAGLNTLQSRRVDPNGGAFKNMIINSSLAKGRSLGGGLAGLDQVLESQKAGRIYSAAANNLGLQGLSQSALSSSASLQDYNRRSQQQADSTNSATFGDAIGAAAGLGFGQYQNVNAQNSTYRSQGLPWKQTNYFGTPIK